MPGLSGGEPAGETGFYGKIPSQGDFVSRRLPAAFVQPWDDWLQACIGHCRAMLGADWERLYREAPVWRFLLAPGTCGASAWAGLVQPSVDRVGRYFPFTVAAELPSDLEVLDTMAAASAWYEHIEREAAALYRGDVALAELDACLQAVRFPAAAIAGHEDADDTLPIAERPVTALKLGCGRQAGLDRARTALREEQVNVGHAHSVWFDANPGALERAVLVTRGLPETALSGALFDGRWAAHGWPCAKADARLFGLAE